MKHADPNSLVITLPAELTERLDQLVEAGEYASKHDVVLEALKIWEERDTSASIDDVYLKQEYDAGLASGEPVSVDIRKLAARFKASMDG